MDGCKLQDLKVSRRWGRDICSGEKKTLLLYLLSPLEGPHNSIYNDRRGPTWQENSHGFLDNFPRVGAVFCSWLVEKKQK